MKIIIEEYQYAVEDVKDILWEGAFQMVDGKVSINYVGYYFNPRQGVNDCVFILPKVLLEVGSDKIERVFGKYLPKDVARGKNEVDFRERCSYLWRGILHEGA